MKRQLWFWVLVAIAAGIVFGLVAPGPATDAKWLADAFLLIGRTADARQLFERLLAIRNDVGLLSEEYDPTRKRLIGNFPQAFSHIALVNSAHNLARAAKPAEQRAAS